MKTAILQENSEIKSAILQEFALKKSAILHIVYIIEIKISTLGMKSCICRSRR